MHSRGSGLDAELLKLSGLPSEDSVRRALRKLVKTEEGPVTNTLVAFGLF